MVHLLKEGKARAIGLSSFAIDDLECILQHSDVVHAVNQVEFHPFLYQKDLLLEAYSPLTRIKSSNYYKYSKEISQQNACSNPDTLQPRARSGCS